MKINIAEQQRLDEANAGRQDWKRWGPYLSERQWGTVREDYSPHGNAWEYLPHDHARSRAYRWGEDGPTWRISSRAGTKRVPHRQDNAICSRSCAGTA